VPVFPLEVPKREGETLCREYATTIRKGAGLWVCWSFRQFLS
jgi:hypothetical protein